MDTPPSASPLRRHAPALILLLLLIGATVFYAAFVHPFYPFQHWLFFEYAKYWLYTAYFGAACLCAGHFALGKLLPEPPTLGERAALAFALGVVIFFLGEFLAGILGLFGGVFFFAWPLVLIAVGARGVVRTARRFWAHARRLPQGSFYPRTAIHFACAAILILGIVLTYLPVMVPLNIGADSHWYHLSIAERYAAAGRITRFDDGNYLAVYPQLASVLYAWAFQSPGQLVDHTSLCAHMEWFLFLATLASITPLVRRLLGGHRVPLAGAAFFLFPGFLVYDSSLISGSDHILAFFAPALAIALIRCGVDFQWRNAVLAALILSGALLTKYQASYFFVVSTLFLLVMLIKTRRFAVAGIAMLTCTLATTPHWLKNLIFYHDPLYPMLHRHLPSTPFHPGAAKLFEDIYWPHQFLLQGTTWEKIRDTLVSVVSFSFVPHDWDFHGMKPVFGSLFTLLLVALPFIKPKKRLWMLALGVHIGVATWFVTAHEDRFLQSLLPWMVACTVAVMSLLWRRGALARAGLVPLVAFQLVWGSDVPFFRVHNMIGDSPLKLAVDLISSGHHKRYAREDRMRLAGESQELGKRLPEKAVVLLHDHLGPLGIGRPVVSDAPGWQGAYDYSTHDSPEDTVAMWRAMKVTHVVTPPRRAGASPVDMAREAAFLRAVDRYTDRPMNIHPFTVTELKSDPLGPKDPTRIAWLGCGGEREPAIYSPQGLADGTPLSPLSGLETTDASELPSRLAAANVVVLRPGCNNLPAVNQFVQGAFRQVLAVGDSLVFLR